MDYINGMLKTIIIDEGKFGISTNLKTRTIRIIRKYRLCRMLGARPLYKVMVFFCHFGPPGIDFEIWNQNLNQIATIYIPYIHSYPFVLRKFAIVPLCISSLFGSIWNRDVAEFQETSNVMDFRFTVRQKFDPFSLHIHNTLANVFSDIT